MVNRRQHGKAVRHLERSADWHLFAVEDDRRNGNGRPEVGRAAGPDRLMAHSNGSRSRERGTHDVLDINGLPQATR